MADLRERLAQHHLPDHDARRHACCTQQLDQVRLHGADQLLRGSRPLWSVDTSATTPDAGRADQAEQRRARRSTPTRLTSRRCCRRRRVATAGSCSRARARTATPSTCPRSSRITRNTASYTPDAPTTAEHPEQALGLGRRRRAQRGRRIAVIPAFLLPNQNLQRRSRASYVNERGFWVLDGCKSNGTGSASSCEVDEDCCGGLAARRPLFAGSIRRSAIRRRAIAALHRRSACAWPQAGVCAVTNDCCIGSVCLTGTCAPPPPLLILGPANYERNYQADCESGHQSRCGASSIGRRSRPALNSKIEFYAQTSAKGTDFATLPVYPAAVTMPGVVSSAPRRAPRTRAGSAASRARY